MPTVSARRVDTAQLGTDLRGGILRLSRRLRAEKADDALSDGQATVLGVIAMRGEVTLSELAEFDHVTLPSMNRTVNTLESAGYLRRDPDAHDRRRVIITLTEAGAEIVLATRQRRDEWLTQRLDALTPAQRRTLADASEIIRGLSTT